MKNFTLVVLLLFVSCSEKTTKESKPASISTKKINDQLAQYLNINDKKDFDNASKGFIGNSKDSFAFEFISNQETPDTVNPSLWRQSKLNNISGLFEVTPGIYQVRGFDLANITFIRGNTGWIVVDPLTSKESAEAALALFRQYQDNAPITGVIYTHSHADHFGGVKGVVSNNNIPIVAPEGFFEEAISENLMAGNTMSRRASYMYGGLLPQNEYGTVDAGLGKKVSAGSLGIIKPTKTIKNTGERYTIDGVAFEFFMAQGTEAPAEFLFYIPKYKAASSAEVMNHTLHNLSTLRGAKTRDSLTWAKSIQYAKEFLDNRTDVIFGSHHWPIWEQDNINEFLVKHGDLYKFIHDQTLRYANMGYTYLEIAEMVTLPDSLAKEFYNRGYYGSINHNVKAVYDFYFGAWWDGNPANLYKLPPVEVAKRYVKSMGGERKTISIAQASYKDGDYRWVVELLNHVIFANPKNQTARNISADAMEQLAYQSESATWRAYLLTGALELRNGINKLPVPNTSSPDIISELPIGDFLDYLAVRINPDKAKDITMILNLSIDGNTYQITINNSVLKYSKKLTLTPDVTITMPRSTLTKLLLKEISLEQLTAEQGSISDTDKFTQFMTLFDTFEFWFNIIEP